MANPNEYKAIAEIYRNREHIVLNFLRKYIKDDALTLDDLEQFLKDHLAATGRTLESPLESPPISLVDAGVRNILLALLAPSQEELGASVVKVRTRKVRSDKGKPRKVKVN
jgi:hypothetical protein